MISTIKEIGPWSSTADGHTANGVANIEISGLWSRKGERTAVPHLGTVDVLSLALQATELALTEFGHLRAWHITTLDVRAPGQPLEDGFDNVPVSVTFRVEGGAAAVEVVIGGFTVGIQLVDRGVLSATGVTRDSVYGALFRTRVPRIGPIARENGGAAATVAVEPSEHRGDRALIDAEKSGGLNVIDAFVAVLQLGQVLLYDLDEITRADSDTLWMRTTRIEAGPGVGSTAGLEVTLEEPRLRTLRDETWRLATITGTVDEIFTVSCAVAHKVPQQQTAPLTQ